MARGTSLLLFFAIAVVGQALTPSSYLTPADVGRIKRVFDSALPYGADLQSMHYAVLGFTLLGENIPEPQKACDALKKHVDASNVESIFYAATTAQTLKNSAKVTCQFDSASAQKVLTEAIKEDVPSRTIHFAVGALSALGVKFDTQKVIAALTAAISADDSALGYAYAFLAASRLSGDLTKFHDSIEDVIAQADEVDEKYLQFEGGLYTTALVVDSSYRLAAVAKKAPTISQDKVIKFANYFLSRKHVQHMRNAATILSTIKTLTDNQYNIPIAVTLASQVSVSEKASVVQVRVSNLLGKSIGKLTVTADTARHLGDDAVVLSKKPFTASASDSSLYELDFVKVKPARGFYRISISVAPQQADKRLIGTSGAEVEVKVTTQVAIESVEIGVADKDQSSAAKTTKLQHPNKAANILEADHHQKILMKFQLRDRSTNAIMTAHQTFVRLTNQKTHQEIIFVAEADSSDTYRFDLDVGGSARDFGFLSGQYSLDLIVGDAVIQNPFSWTVADVSLIFSEGATPTEGNTNRYSKKPELKHLFREPEKRPPQAFSALFTGLVLLPLLVLVILWIRIGVNVSNFPFSLSAIGFHLGLGAIFGLYYCYWVNLTMFQTLRYLGFLAIPTFLFGNRLLSGIAARRK